MMLEDDEDASLGDRLTAIHGTLKALRADLDRDNKKRDQRIRLHRIAIVCAFLVAGFGIFVGAWGVHEVRNSNNERDKARVAACRQYNDQERQGIAAEIAQSHDLVEALAASSPVRNQAAVDAYNKNHDALIRMGHPLRDCSPVGIDKYLNASRG